MDQVVAINSERVGTGNDDLGTRLMGNFLKTLMGAEKKPRMLVLYNAGVKLAAKGSPVLESLHSLENQGVEIISCGTCVNFFGLAEQMEAGRVSNMQEIVKVLTEAPAVITI